MRGRRTVPPSAEIEAQIDQLLAVGVGESPREALSELAKLGVAYTCELFDGTHARLTYRYPGAIRELVTALAP